MSNDLIKRLRKRGYFGTPLFNRDGPEAADRIEELERDQKQNGEDYCALMEKHDALHVKLAKAVEIGNKMAASINGNYYIPNVVAEWNAVLAKLEGGE